MFVLDAGNHLVRVFDLRGNYLAAFGRRGEGPGEFRHPVALAILDSKVAILDVGYRRVSFFEERNGEYQFSGSFRLLWPALGMCNIGNRLFMVGYSDGRIVHEVSPSGRRLTELPVGSIPPLLRAANGYVIGYTRTPFPRVTIYRAEW